MMTPQERRQAALDNNIKRFQPKKQKQKQTQAPSRARTRPPGAAASAPVAPAPAAPAPAPARRPAPPPAPPATAPTNQPTERAAALESVTVTVAPTATVTVTVTVTVTATPSAAPAPAPAVTVTVAPAAAPAAAPLHQARPQEVGSNVLPPLDTIDEESESLLDDSDDDHVDEPPHKEELSFRTMRDMMRRHIETLQARAEEEEPSDDDDDEEEEEEDSDESVDDGADECDTGEGLDRTRAKIFTTMAKLQQSPFATANDSHKQLDDSEETSQELLLEMRMLRQATSASIDNDNDNGNASALVDRHSLAHADSLERSSLIEAPTASYSLTSETSDGPTGDQLPPHDLERDMQEVLWKIQRGVRDLEQEAWEIDVQARKWRMDVVDHYWEQSYRELEWQLQEFQQGLAENTFTWSPPPPLTHRSIMQDPTGLVSSADTRARFEADMACVRRSLDKVNNDQEQINNRLVAMSTDLQAATVELELEQLGQHDQLDQLDHDHQRDHDNHHHGHNDPRRGSSILRSSEQQLRPDADETGVPRLETCLQAVPCHYELGKPSTGWTALAHRRQQLTCESQAGCSSTRRGWMPVD